MHLSLPVRPSLLLCLVEEQFERPSMMLAFNAYGNWMVNGEHGMSPDAFDLPVKSPYLALKCVLNGP